MGLREFAQIRYDIKKRSGNNDEFEKYANSLGFEKAKPKSTEELYKQYVEKADLKSWHNIRGPREGEDSRVIQEELRRKMKDEELSKQ